MTNEKKLVESEGKKQKKKPFSGIAAVSLLIALLDKIGNFIYDRLISGFIGRIFTSHSRLQGRFEKGFCGRILFGNHKLRRICRRIRRFLSGIVDSSYFSSRCKKATDYLCSIPVSFYANFTLFFGIYTIVVYLVKLFLLDGSGIDDNYIFAGVCLIICSLPAMLSKSSLAMAVKKSFIFKMIFSDAFGISEQTLDQKQIKIKGRGNYMLFLGLFAGTLTFFVHPLVIISVIALAIFLSLIMAAPEIGVLLSTVTLPFLSFFENPTIVLCALIVVTTLSYLLKLLRGKRVFRLELIDAFVLLFGAMILLSTVFSAGGDAAISSAMVTVMLLLGYFLTVNLMRSERWVKRCIIGLATSSFVVAAVGIFEYFFGQSSSNWLDLSLFSDIRLRVGSFFGNPNILSTFMVMIFPFVLALLCVAKHKNEKILTFFVGAAIVACTVFTWSRGSWLAIIVSSIAFFLMYNRKTFRVFGAALLIIPALPLILPDSIYNRLISIMNLSDSSISYRLYTWEGTTAAIKDNLLGGIGFGNEAFREVYPRYAYAGMESAEHSHSLYLQLLLGLGIVGIVVFAVILFFCFQKFFEYIKTPENRESKIYVMAIVASLVASIVMGIFDYIWYNYRVLYVFWMIIAIGCAIVRVGNYERTRKSEIEDYTPKAQGKD